MSTGGPDLFVVCKNCQAEVSPYITECPYCGSRLRKRAPKIDRDGRVSERRRRNPAPSLPRLRRGEIPGIAPDRRPYASIALTVVGLVGCLLWRTGLVDLGQLGVIGMPTGHWWRLATAPFAYDNTGYAAVTIGAIALYGWLLERRVGPLAVLALFAVGGVGGIAASAALEPNTFVLGAGGAAIGFIVTWMIPDLFALRGGEEIEGDLLGSAVFGIVVALMPLVVSDASWAADGAGVVAGLAVGLPLAQFAR